MRAEAASGLAGALAQLDSTLARLLALLDQQPDLRAEPAVAAGLRELHDVDLRLAFARQLFNEAVQTYNAAARQFPTRLLTRLYGFGTAGPAVARGHPARRAPARGSAPRRAWRQPLVGGHIGFAGILSIAICVHTARHSVATRSLCSR